MPIVWHTTLFRCGGLVTSGISKAGNKVQDDSDGQELCHFKQGCEMQAAASLDMCLSEEGVQEQQANGGLQVGER